MRKFRLIVLALTLCLTAAWSRADIGPDPQAPTASAPPDLTQLPALANAGRFDRVLDLLRDGQLAGKTPALASLIQELEQYQLQQAQRDQKRREQLDKALREMNQRAAAGRLEDALISAIEAHGLSDNPALLLQDQSVVDLVGRAQAAAQEAEQQGDWLEVLNLYRVLNLLYETQATYLAPSRDAERHVRVLRMYAPKKLEQLLQARAAARLEKRKQDQPDDAGNDQARPDAEPAKIDLGDETWQQRLEAVDMNMLRQALAPAVKHVDNAGWQPLVSGMINALLVMVQTPQLIESFPAYADAQKVARFRDFLLEQRDLTAKRAGSVNLIDATRLIERVTAVNNQTLGLPEAVLAFEMADGAMSNLDDFSAVIWPREMEQFTRSFSGKFYGVGIQISKRDGRLIVVSPLAGTPAMAAGIKAGDIIAQVDRRDTSAWSLDKAVREITGPLNTTVTLGIERTGVPDLIEFRIKRAEIPIESIRGWRHTDDGQWDYYIDPDARIGYIRLSQFIPQTADDLDAAINKMRGDHGLEALILDLRFDPGGLLGAAVDVADRFIQSGPIVSTVDSAGTRTTEARATRSRTHRPMELVVLINQGSASASEIVAGALQDYGRATIVGERSYGKGSVQDLFKIEGGKAYLKLTTQYYMLPKGRIIHRRPGAATWGIEPDLVVKVTNKQIADALELRQKADVLRAKGEAPDDKDAPPTARQLIDSDSQLQAALLMLKTRQAARTIVMAQRDAAVNVP